MAARAIGRSLKKGIQMPHIPKSHKERKISCNTMLTLDAIRLAELLVSDRQDIQSRSALVEELIAEEASRRNIKLGASDDE